MDFVDRKSHLKLHNASQPGPKLLESAICWRGPEWGHERDVIVQILNCHKHRRSPELFIFLHVDLVPLDCFQPFWYSVLRNSQQLRNIEQPRYKLVGDILP